jgi:hypothetical protein
VSAYGSETEAKHDFDYWRRKALDEYRQNPLLGAGVALAAGFVLGGGLATGTTLRMLRKSVGLVFQAAVMPALLSRLRDAIVDEVGEARLAR